MPTITREEHDRMKNGSPASRETLQELLDAGYTIEEDEQQKSKASLLDYGKPKKKTGLADLFTINARRAKEIQ